RFSRDWSSDVCSSDLMQLATLAQQTLLDHLADVPRQQHRTVGRDDAQHAAGLVAQIGEMHGRMQEAELDPVPAPVHAALAGPIRSEERRVGKKCILRW